MNLKKFFSRKVTCDTAELKETINYWCKNGGWKFNDFAYILKLIGIKTPVKLSEYNKEDYSFKCVTALNQEVRISLFVGDEFNSCSKVYITSSTHTRVYDVYKRYYLSWKKVICVEKK